MEGRPPVPIEKALDVTALQILSTALKLLGAGLLVMCF
jgi:hypothetical protein